MLRTTLAAQFQNELGDPAVRTLARTRLTSAGLGYGTIGLAALMWLAAGPSYALWIWLTGWLGVAVVAVVGFRRVVRKATVFLGVNRPQGPTSQLRHRLTGVTSPRSGRGRKGPLSEKGPQ